MALIGLHDISMAYGGPKLLAGATLQVERGERICLVGRNGEGKSTLLRILADEETPDAGEVTRQAGVRVGFLGQQVPTGVHGTVEQVVRAGLPVHHEEWDAVQSAKLAAEKLGLDPNAVFENLSGGQKRRALLARALASEPDVLLLDEPTNHLDIASIEWMESLLLRYSGAIVFVTHDRAFLRRLATRIIELDRGRLSSWSCSYDRYVELRQEQLEAEEKQNAVFDKKLAQEEAWVRQGIKARRTRNEGRVRALYKLRAERAARREVLGRASIEVQEADLSGQKVIVAKGVSYAWDNHPVVSDFSARIMRGDKIGIIGPNGCGKTTLLNLLLGRLAPQSGTVKHGTNLEVAYFDQHRAALDEERTVVENVCGSDTHILFNGRRRHVITYLEDFLFPPERARTPVKALSGGERNRLLLAKLFTRPANVLVLDEPTNDLDMETLDLLENLLVEYGGTVLLVSHDRDFLDNVVTSTLVFESDGVVREYPGGYGDWIAQRPVKIVEQKDAESTERKSAKKAVGAKLSNKEREELESLPRKIEALESELAALQERINDASFYRGDPADVKAVTGRLEQLPAEIEQAYTRWHELEERG